MSILSGHQFIEPGVADLLRHGRTERDNIFRGRTDDPLTDIGWQQMLDSTQGERWDNVVCSPLSRCRKFAEHIAEICEVELTIEPRFQEYDFGDWDGQTYDDIMLDQSHAVTAFFADPYSATPPNGEDFTQFKARVLSAWHEVLEAHHLQRTLIVSHGGAIMTVLADVFGVDRLHGCIDMSYGCRSQVRLDQLGKRPRLIFHK